MMENGGCKRGKFTASTVKNQVSTGQRRCKPSKTLRNAKGRYR